MSPDARPASPTGRAVSAAEASAAEASAAEASTASTASTAEASAAEATAAEAWAEVQAFMAGEDRRHALRVELDLGVAKAELLIRLAGAPMTLREIALAGDADPSAATVAVDRLERRGLVRRGPHPEDNRRKLVHLTDAGRRAAATAQRILTDPPAALAALSADDLAALTRIFATLNRPDDQAGKAGL